MALSHAIFFFFSSRRRHTRCYRDWSSDVCSSDLNPVGPLQGFEHPEAFRLLQTVAKSGIVFGIRSGGLLLRKTSRLQFQIGNIEVKHRPCRNNDSSFDHILEFAYVPGPLVSAQRVHRRGWNRVNHLVHAPAELLRKVADEQRNILLTLPQGWDGYGKDVDAKKQIGPKLLLRHHGFQVAVGSSNQTRICAESLRASQPFELALLQHAKKFRLQFERNFPNFVQKNRSAIGHFETSDALRDRSCECAFLMPKELAFEQASRDRRAIQLYEGLRASRAQIMNGPGNQLFARACFAIDEHGGISRRHRPYLF